jgi:hypothetical protein
MEALSQLSYGPVRKMLILKGKPVAVQAPMGPSPPSEGRENTRNPLVAKRSPGGPVAEGALHSEPRRDAAKVAFADDAAACVATAHELAITGTR